MTGCLKGIVRLGCAAVLICALALVWWFRAPIMQTFAHWFGRSTALPSVADTAVGAPTPRATASGKEKVGRLETNAGPDSVILTPNEVASLIGSGIDWSVRKMYDSLRVELQEGTLVLHARLDTRALPPGTLGPFAGMFGPREPLRMAGDLARKMGGGTPDKSNQNKLRGILSPAKRLCTTPRRQAWPPSVAARSLNTGRPRPSTHL